MEQVASCASRSTPGRRLILCIPLSRSLETKAMKAAMGMHEHLSKVVYPDITVGLLHGKMKSDEKESAMDKFARGETKILVATTVIEVGVDVPNATVMVIEQAERFGLSQLHQLRGRVGRGGGQSYCILVTEKLNQIAQERIRTMVESSDGFHIAEVDMKLPRARGIFRHQTIRHARATDRQHYPRWRDMVRSPAMKRRRLCRSRPQNLNCGERFATYTTTGSGVTA